MSVGVEHLRAGLQDLVELANAEEKLRSLEASLLLPELLDADEQELGLLVADLQALHLKDPNLEAKLKAIAASGAPSLAFLLKMVKLFAPGLLPKP